MIPRIKKLEPLKDYKLHIEFDDGKRCIYDVLEDINAIKVFEPLKYIPGLFEQVQLDESRTCVYWNDEIDLASDTIYEYGKQVQCGTCLKKEYRQQITVELGVFQY